MYSATKVALFRIADSVAHFVHDQGLRIFEMAPGVVETTITKSMPVHDFRGEGDWTSPEQVTDLAVASASGTLDAFTRQYVGRELILRCHWWPGGNRSDDFARRLVLGCGQHSWSERDDSPGVSTHLATSLSHKSSRPRQSRLNSVWPR